MTYIDTFLWTGRLLRNIHFSNGNASFHIYVNCVFTLTPTRLFTELTTSDTVGVIVRDRNCLTWAHTRSGTLTDDFISCVALFPFYVDFFFTPAAGFDINFLTNLSIRASAILILLARNCKLLARILKCHICMKCRTMQSTMTVHRVE